MPHGVLLGNEEANQGGGAEAARRFITLERLLTEVFGPKGAAGRPVLIGPDCDNEVWFDDFWSELARLGRQPLIEWFTYHWYGTYDFMPRFAPAYFFHGCAASGV